MAHVTALAAARHHLLAQRGWEVETRGLFAAPPIRIFTGELRHESVERAVRILGLGTDCLHKLPCGSDGALQIDALDQALRSDSDLPTVVCLQAGEINTGAFDPFEQAIELAHKHGAWVHVDGAFGLWARVSPKYSDLLAGVENADSWATDAHKWLNVPFDSGMLFVAHPEAHRAAMSTRASYLIHSQDSSRDQIDWTPEWSRRGRAVPIYAAIRHLGRSGLRDLIERCCAHAHRLVNEIGQLPGAEVIAPAIINQGLVRFLADDGDHNRRTDLVIEKIQEEGTAWFGGTTWGGQRAMRISVCNWQTSEQDVDRTIAAVRAILLQ